MNKNRQLIVATAVLLVALLAVGLAYSTFVVRSNIVHVSVDYAVVLSYTINNGTLQLTAHVQHETAPLTGKGVSFYKCNSFGNITLPIGYATTNANGSATFNYTLTGAGDYYFLAEATMP